MCAVYAHHVVLESAGMGSIYIIVTDDSQEKKTICFDSISN